MGKGSMLEGGHHVPAIMSWPNKIPAGKECHFPLMTMDLFPTFARLSGGSLPANYKIDGGDIQPALQDEQGISIGCFTGALATNGPSAREIGSLSTVERYTIRAMTRENRRIWPSNIPRSSASCFRSTKIGLVRSGVAKEAVRSDGCPT